MNSPPSAIDAFRSLSPGAKNIWAKASNKSNDGLWLPLAIHMSDSANIARLLWQEWIPFSTQKLIAEEFKGLNEKDAFTLGEKLLIFLAAAHDVGKATPAFQYGQSLRYTNEKLAQELMCAVESEGLLIRDDLQLLNKIHHSLASQEILKRNGFGCDVAITLGGHHGRPPSHPEIEMVDSYPNHTGFNDEGWCSVQRDLLNYAAVLSGSDISLLRSVKLPITVQVILTGLIIMADWIASDEQLFPYIEEPYYTEEDFSNRAYHAWRELGLPGKWGAGDRWKSEDLFKERFDKDFCARPVQRVAEHVAKDMKTPGMMIIEAPMGEGKTEAALVAAEILAEKFGLGGLFFALPTQATADGIFPRMIKWISKVASEYYENRSIFLAHGKSAFNTEYRQVKRNTINLYGLDSDGNEGKSSVKDGIIVHEWFNGRKKGLLSDFVIGTVDQVLMGGLRQKHLALRHVALANKIIIIDEVHAYDAYMGSYLHKALQWLGAYNVPVILLSATLPQERRKDLVNAYLNLDPKQKGDSETQGSWASNPSYPLITYTDCKEVKQIASDTSSRKINVKIERIQEENLLAVLDSLTDGGGYIGIIVNTVKKAQKISESLRTKYGEECVYLLHSRFVSIERTLKEKEVREMISEKRKTPPYRAFVVGTQVMEQSLDLDFDLMITDLCPMDLLLQRIGRLHRHNNPRPEKLKEAQCFVLDQEDDGFDSGSEAIYGKYHLMNTHWLLPPSISLPGDIPVLVQSAYSQNGIEMPPGLQNEYREAKGLMDRNMDIKEEKAKAFQIKKPKMGMNGLIGWLDWDKDDDSAGKAGEAAVRDTESSLEVIIIQQRGNKFYMLPINDILGGVEIPSSDKPDERLCFTLAGCKITLPRYFSAQWQLSKTIRELEADNIRRIPTRWQESSWLAGELFLILDENNTALFNGKKLTYNNRLGLCMEDTK